MLVKKIIPSSVKLFVFSHMNFFNAKKKHIKKKLKYALSSDDSFNIDNKRKWIKKWNKAIYSDLNLYSIAELFAKAKIKILKEIELNDSDLVLICVEKNDIVKIKEFIKHYRSIGVNKFIFLDNNSNDGTKEYLLNQDDVILLETKEKYSSPRRVAWINRIIAHYGDNRWYIVVDSDELLVYSDYENKSINEVIDYCINKKYVRARALLVDMYAKKEYYVNGNKEEFMKNCVFFDTDSYYSEKNIKFMYILGGPRSRVLKTNACLTKYTLFYFRKKDVFINSHLMFPYKDNLNKECVLILKHYKFLPNEIKKYIENAKNENYYNKSEEYKKYLEYMSHNELDFMYSGSEKYINSKSLERIKEFDKILW